MIRRLFERLLDGREEPARAPFARCPTYQELADMSLEERVRHPEVAVPPEERELVDAEPADKVERRRDP